MSQPMPIDNHDQGVSRVPFVLLAKRTGLTAEFLAQAAAKGELRSIIEDRNGNNARGRDPRVALLELRSRRHAPEPRSAREALVETLAKRWPEHEIG